MKTREVSARSTSSRRDRSPERTGREPSPKRAPVRDVESVWMPRLRRPDGVRMDRVAQARAAIAAGVYEGDLLLDIALDRMLDELCPEEV